MITLTNLSILVPDGNKRGNITPAINKTVIRGTPLQNSINPIEKYLITGRLDLLPIANNIPIGKQKIIANIEITKVRNNPPHSRVSTGANPKKPPEKSINDKIGNGKTRKINRYFLNLGLKKR